MGSRSQGGAEWEFPTIFFCDPRAGLHERGDHTGGFPPALS